MVSIYLAIGKDLEGKLIQWTKKDDGYLWRPACPSERGIEESNH